MVGSFLGYTSFVGYSSYSSGKYALRGESGVRLVSEPQRKQLLVGRHRYALLTVGLADSLRNEMLLHDISIHYFAPAGIDTPGNAAEQEFKPAPTKKLEEGDKLQSADECAGHLFRGALGRRSAPRLPRLFTRGRCHRLMEQVSSGGTTSPPRTSSPSSCA